MALSDWAQRAYGPKRLSPKSLWPYGIRSYGPRGLGPKGLRSLGAWAQKPYGHRAWAQRETRLKWVPLKLGPGVNGPGPNRDRAEFKWAPLGPNLGVHFGCGLDLDPNIPQTVFVLRESHGVSLVPGMSPTLWSRSAAKWAVVTNWAWTWSGPGLGACLDLKLSQTLEDMVLFGNGSQIGGYGIPRDPNRLYGT